MKRSFLSLAALTAIAVLALLFVPQDTLQESSALNELLVADVSKQINEVDRVEVVAPGNTTVASMVRTDAGWQLEQMGGYHANWQKLQSLLAAVAQAKVVAVKTDKPEYYSRLGVEDIEQGAAGNVLLNIGVGDRNSGILIGHATQGRPGQFVRLQDQEASVEIDRKLEVSMQLSDWVDTSIIDINQSEVAEVEIIHPGGERLLVTRISADQTDFDLVGMPEGREVQSSWSVNSLGSVLSMLELESVQAAEELNWAEATKLRLLMFSGVEVLAEILAVEDSYLMSLHASHPAANVINTGKPTDSVTTEQQAIDKRAAEDIANRVERINLKVDGWVYGISKQKYDAMNSRLEDVLKPVEAP